jgi:hypothetical protein
MGNLGSKAQVDGVICNKETFLLLIEVIADAEKVSSYYAELLLQEEPLPLALNYYENYSKTTERFFNKTRKQKIESINMSYHDFYNQLAYLNYLYERPINNNELRRKILLEIFSRAFTVQKHLISDIYNLCKNGF